jgi:hypothetical protein
VREHFAYLVEQASFWLSLSGSQIRGPTQRVHLSSGTPTFVIQFTQRS